MKLISRETYNTLKKKAAVRKLKKSEQMLVDQYNEERGPRLIAFLATKMGLDRVLESLEDHVGRDTFKSDVLWHLAMHGDSHMVITGLNLNTHEKLKDFVEKEIHTSCNEQMAFVFG